MKQLTCGETDSCIPFCSHSCNQVKTDMRRASPNAQDLEDLPMHTGITLFTPGKQVMLGEIFRFCRSKYLGNMSKTWVNHRFQQHRDRRHPGDPTSLIQ